MMSKEQFKERRSDLFEVADYLHAQGLGRYSNSVRQCARLLLQEDVTKVLYPLDGDHDA